MMTNRLTHVPTLVPTLVLMLMAVCAPGAVSAGELADGEEAFVRQLLERGLFALAEQFCEEQLELVRSVSERAEWEALLSECHEQHAWSMSEDSRSGGISLAAQRITEFLRTNTVSPEQELLLRVRQIELLASAGRMEEVVRRSVSHVPASSIAAAAGVRPKLKGTKKFALDALSQGLELAESLLKQIEQIRRDLDSEVVRSIRERIRASLAQMLFSKSRLSAEATDSATRNAARAVAEQLMKSTRDERLRFRMNVLLAEDQLDRGDLAGFSLRMTKLSSEASVDDERAQAAALNLRGLLQQSQPSDALQEYVRLASAAFATTQELQTLRLQAMLQLMEVLDQLETSSETKELREKTAAEFLTLKDQTLAGTRGVWQELCSRIVTRFERVRQVGAAAAADLEQIAELADDGDLPTARQTLRSVFLRLRDQPALSAFILLQSGDMAIRLRDWDAATADLRQARDFFLKTDDLPSAAAADLLRVYAVGQQWQPDASDKNAEQRYRAALEDHLQMFAGQPTLVRAREWRARLLQVTDPLAAASELLDVVQIRLTAADENAAQERKAEKNLQLLCLACVHLLDALEAQPLAADPLAAQDVQNDAWAVVIGRLKTLSDASRADRGGNEDRKSLSWIMLEALQAGLQLKSCLPGDTDWKTLEATTRHLIDNLSSGGNKTDTDVESASSAKQSTSETVPVAETESETTVIAARAVLISHGMVVLSSCRQLDSYRDFDESGKLLAARPWSERISMTRLLMRQLSGTQTPLPGDSPLAGFLLRLVDEESSAGLGLTVEQKIEQLQIVQVLCQSAGTRAPCERLLASLIAINLSDSQLLQLAAVMTDAGRDSAQSDPASVRRFWQAVQKRTKSGEDLWLEASLQMAQLCADAGDREEAARILGVVDVLHPEWGKSARKMRAAELRRRLEESP